MNIKVGFTDNPRELVISAQDKREEIVSALSDGLRAGSGFIEITDSKGQTYFINAGDVAYVEVGSEARPAVGFGGA